MKLGHLRRARRRPGVGRVLPRARARLRLMLAVPRSARPARGGAGGAHGVGRRRPSRSAARPSARSSPRPEDEQHERQKGGGGEVPHEGAAGVAPAALPLEPLGVWLSRVIRREFAVDDGVPSAPTSPCRRAQARRLDSNARGRRFKRRRSRGVAADAGVRDRDAHDRDPGEACDPRQRRAARRPRGRRTR